MRQVQLTSHTLAGLALVYVALSEERGGGPLPWAAGIAAVLLLGLVGWEQLQFGAQPLSAEIAAELLGIGVLVGAAVLLLRAGARLVPLGELVLAAALGVALALHRRPHRTGHIARKGAPG